jgi:acyl-CoA reductase-like NAD-dependent aldehyde dehydrogenase
VNQQTFSPIDGKLVFERPYAAQKAIDYALAAAHIAQAVWKKVPLVERIAVCDRFVELMVARKDELGAELTQQMGRPIRYTPGEIATMGARATTMASIATEALADIVLPKEGFTRYIRREPLGVVLAIVPWNYPYLTAVNVVVPALLAGNAVVLKPSPHTPLTGERMAEAVAEAGLSEGLFQVLHLTPEQADAVVQRPDVDYVAFTGSVKVGRLVQKAASDRFIGVGLELGGKDPAYVRADADLDFAAENVLDGAFFNSGQSCCAIERVYVHRSVYDQFLEKAVAITRGYVLGDPTNPETTLGPLVRTSSADFVRGQIAEAVAQGARCLIDEAEFPASKPGTPYLAPQIVVDVNHSMRLMTEETFGPVVGVMAVDSDEEAVRLMNNSDFGLTASIWTRDVAQAELLGDQLETGTVFLNRCDYLDPELPWVGVKDSGRGCTLSTLGYSHLTRPKSFHLRNS